MVFHPRTVLSPVPETETLFSVCFSMNDDIKVCGRFHKAEKPENAPNLLFFHGNGEIAHDYDDLGSIYQKKGINFCIVDYRGYGAKRGYVVHVSPLAVFIG